MVLRKQCSTSWLELLLPPKKLRSVEKLVNISKENENMGKSVSAVEDEEN